MMNCIFKTLGYVPKNRNCVKCNSLEKLLNSAGLSKEAAIRSSDMIHRAYNWLALEDTFRDEPITKKVIARALSIPYWASFPRPIRRSLKKLNSTVIQLENSCDNPANYIEALSSLSGSLFEEVASLFEETGSKEPNKRLNAIGTTLTGVILFQDMVNDLPMDTKTHKFNLLRNYNYDETKALANEYTARFKELADPFMVNISVTSKKEKNYGSFFMVLAFVMTRVLQRFIVVKSLYKKN